MLQLQNRGGSGGDAMSDLDKRLKEITQTLVAQNLERHWPKHGTTGDAIEAIKQAFIDEGWSQNPTWNEVILASQKMTGPEWMARFRDEFPRAGLLPELQDFHAQVMDPARRAAGVDE